MIIDVIFYILIAVAIIKGYQKGLIVAVFSLLAFIIGLAAAMKLSAVVAGYIGKIVNVSDKWLPVISFILVFVLVVIVVRWAAALLQKAVETVLLGWANRIGGIIVYVALYTTIFSVVLFYAKQMNLLKQETITASKTWTFIQPWGPKAIDGFAVVVPFFKDMFRQLESFFGTISEQVKQPT
ncbi:MAG: CvpA family protein [Chitinophagaceae bacterium]